jgi:hypothetical protein
MSECSTGISITFHVTGVHTGEKTQPAVDPKGEVPEVNRGVVQSKEHGSVMKRRCYVLVCKEGP